MTQLAAPDPAWAARVAGAGVRLELFDTLDDDYDYVDLEGPLLAAAREGSLSDEDLYPLLARFSIGRAPDIDWPTDAAGVARRCAVALAGRGARIELRAGQPNDRTRRIARDAVVNELRLNPSDLLGVLADHWQKLGPVSAPNRHGCSLLAFGQQLLLEPVVGACMLIWSTLQSSRLEVAVDPSSAASTEWEEWSPAAADGWIEVAHEELARLGPPARRPPGDVDQCADALARARASLLRPHGDPRRVGESIVRTSGWPGDPARISPLAVRAVERALERIEDVDLHADTDRIVTWVQSCVMPDSDALVDWVRDLSFATLGNREHGLARTGDELLQDAAAWLAWSLADAAVDVVSEMGRASANSA